MNKQEAIYFARFADRFHNFSMEELDKLHRAETTLRRIFTNQCNGYVTNRGDHTEWLDALEIKEEKKADNIMDKIRKLIESKGYSIRFNHDPRGSALRLFLNADDLKNESQSYYIGW